MVANISFFPFDAGPGSVSMENRWGDMMKYMRTTGILTTSDTLSPTGDSAIAPQLNMQVQAYDGEAWIEGFMFIHTGDTYPIVIPDNTSGDPRIDLVTLRLDRDANTIEYHVEEGTPDPSPVAPTPVEDDVIWDLPLAEIDVVDGATEITSGDITDVRVRSTQGEGGSSAYTPYCSVTNTLPTGFTNGSNTLLLWDTNLFDPTDMHSTTTDTGRINIAVTGLYAINLIMQISFSGTPTSAAYVTIFKNTGGIAVPIASNGFFPNNVLLVNTSCVYPLTAGDFVYSHLNNVSGVTLTSVYQADYSPVLSVSYAGSL